VLSNIIGNATQYAPLNIVISIQAFVAKEHTGYLSEDDEILQDTKT
jgi:hypothetical protein